jgi:hypothetical protein
MQTDAVDCEALSTPLLRMDANGENSKLARVYVSAAGFVDSAPRTCFPKSMRTRAQACCTVFVVYLKYECRI